MGFDIYGVAAKSERGEYFRNNVWWWRPLQVLILLSCYDILSDKDKLELGFNDGHAYSEKQALAIAERLAAIAGNDEVLERAEQYIMRGLPQCYQGCFSQENILEFIGFLKDSGGFKVC